MEPSGQGLQCVFVDLGPRGGTEFLPFHPVDRSPLEPLCPGRPWRPHAGLCPGPVVEDGGQGQSSLSGFPDATAVASDGLCAFGPENGHATAHRPPLFCPIGRHLSGFYHRLPPSDLLGGDQYRPFLFDRLFWIAPHIQKSILPLLFWFLGHGMPYFLPWDIGLAVPAGLR